MEAHPQWSSGKWAAAANSVTRVRTTPQRSARPEFSQNEALFAVLADPVERLLQTGEGIAVGRRGSLHRGHLDDQLGRMLERFDEFGFVGWFLIQAFEPLRDEVEARRPRPWPARSRLL